MNIVTIYSTYYDPLIEEELEIILSIFPASFYYWSQPSNMERWKVVSHHIHQNVEGGEDNGDENEEEDDNSENQETEEERRKRENQETLRKCVDFALADATIGGALITAGPHIALPGAMIVSCLVAMSWESCQMAVAYDFVTHQ